jgi:predicted XRE-type DNA-binding protein
VGRMGRGKTAEGGEAMTERYETAIEVAGSLFKHLGFENHEEEDAKTQLLARICKVMAARAWSKTQLAQALQMDKSDVTRLLKGDLDRFSIERMMRILRALGAPVRITWVDEPTVVQAAPQV